MRKLLIIFGLLICAMPAHATVTKVQAISATCATNPCTSVTIASTGSGNLLVAVLGGSNSAATITAISCTPSCGTWTHCASCISHDATAGTIDAEYILSSSSGGLLLSMTSSNTPDAMWFYEFSSTATPFLLDTQGTRDQTTAVTSAAGVTLTLTGSNDVIIQSGVCAANISSITTYTLNGNPNGNGSAYLLNTASGTAPTWTQTSGRDAFNAIAFKESGGGAAATGVDMQSKRDRLEE